MLKIKPIWLRYHSASFKAFCSSIKRMLPWALLVVCAFYLFASIVSFFSLSIGIQKISATMISFDKFEEFIKMITTFKEMHYVVGMISMTLILFSAPLAFLIFNLYVFISDIIFHLFYSGDLQTRHNFKHYSIFFRKKLDKYWNLIFAFVFAILAIDFVLITKIYNHDLIFTIKHASNMIYSIAIGLYAYTWFNYLSVRKVSRSRFFNITRLDIYLFSKITLRRRFKNIIDTMVFFVFLGWIFVPGLFSVLENLADAVSHNIIRDVFTTSNWDYMVNNGYNIGTTSYDATTLPAPSELKGKLFWWGNMFYISNLKPLLPAFQNKLFNVLIFIAFLEIGVPSIINICIYKKKRKAVINIFISVLKTTIITLSFQYIMAKLFFINTSLIFGSSTLFMFIISLFLLQQVEVKHEYIDKPNKTLNADSGNCPAAG